MRRFFILTDELKKEFPTIVGADAHHIHTVLRLQPGVIVGLFDGKGLIQQAKIVSISDKEIRFRLLRKEVQSAESPIHITIAQALIKGQKLDDLLRPLTELGVYEIVPFIATRSVAVPDAERAQKRHMRWEKIVLESMKQCGRQVPPIIHMSASFEEMLLRAKTADMKLLFWEEAKTPLEQIFIDVSMPKRLFAAIGPEGGFTKDETNAAQKAGFVSASLGRRVLRTETAAVTIASILQYQFGDLACGGDQKS